MTKAVISSFFKVPLEIRQQIYAYVLPCGFKAALLFPQTQCLRMGLAGRQPPSPSILRVNKQIAQEAWQICIELNVVLVRGQRSSEEVLTRFKDRDALTSLRALTIDTASPKVKLDKPLKPHEITKFIRQLPNLNNVTVPRYLLLKGIRKERHDRYPKAYKPTALLKSLVKTRSIKVITMKITMRMTMKRYGNRDPAVRALKDWVTKESGGRVKAFGTYRGTIY
jgi:hypothetical protein